jgi:uncharacterized protein YndB with AHSA1/START domain
MRAVERTVTVDQPPGKVWAYLSDFANTTEWDPPTVTTVRTSGDGGVGTTYHNVSRLLGSEQEVTYTVSDYVEGSRLQLSGDAGSVHLLDTITVEPWETGTRVTYRAEFEPRGAAKLAEPLLPAGLKLLADQVAKSLEDHLRSLS